MVDRNKEPGWQCIRCATVVYGKEQPEKCKDCESRMFRQVRPGQPFDKVNPAAVAHLKKKVENCFNFDIDPETKAETYHRLKLVPVITRQGNSIQITDRCEICQEAYFIRQIPKSREDTLAHLGIDPESKK